VTDLLNGAALVAYGAAVAVLALSFVREVRGLSRIGTGLFAAGVVLHAGALADYVREWGELPLVGLGPSLTSLGFLLGLAALLSVTIGRAGPLGLVLVPLVAALQAGSLAAGVRPSGEAGEFQGGWFVLHVVLAFSGYVGLTVAFAAGLMYVLQFRELKSKRFGAIFRFFPPLDTLDRVGRLGLAAGFGFLTLALLVGAAWSARFGGALPSRNPDIIWGVLTWVVLAGALAARTGKGRRGHRGAVASVVGFVVVIATYLLLRIHGDPAGGFL
jgi:HemX protein